METNNKYKSSVFSFLFSNPDILRELYCALKGVSLPADIPITINTLSNVLFMDKINDISFEIGEKLVILVEHQSTINRNMALRLLLYIARVYEKIIQDKKIYATRKITIPRPEFFVLYNGVDFYPDASILKLSDSFDSTDASEISAKENIALELEVKVYNINAGRNDAIVRQCRTLMQYSSFVAKEREYESKGIIRGEAIKRAVNYCRDHDILKEFLEQNASEVMNMLMTEWNWDDALDVRYEEGREEGMEQGMVITARNALAKGIPIETVQEITGLGIDAIRKIGSGE